MGRDATLPALRHVALASALLAASLPGICAAGQSATLAGQEAPSTEGCTERPADSAAPPSLAVGTCFLSALDERDPLNENQARYEEYALALRRGQAVQIDMDALPSPDDPPGTYGFDTYLELRRAGAVEPLTMNDDRPGSLNSRLVFVGREDATYTVSARSFGARAGRYVLRVTAVAAPQDAQEITGGRFRVELPAATERVPQPTRTYYFDGQANERVRLTMADGPEPVFLELADVAGMAVGSVQSLTRQERTQRRAGAVRGATMSGDLTHLLAVLPAEGRYYVKVSSDSANRVPPFDVVVERAMPPDDEQAELIRAEVPVTGALTLGSASEAGEEDGATTGSFYQLYFVETDANRPVTITVEAIDEGIDPIVDVGVKSDLGFAAAATDDDSGGNLNSRLVVPPPHPARLLIRVRSFELAVGRFRLTASQAAHTQRVFIHHSGSIAGDRVAALTGTLRSAGWQVQGDRGQLIPTAAGFNEVRYSAEGDRAAAEALAAELTRAGAGGRPVTTRRLRVIRPGILEVWISN